MLLLTHAEVSWKVTRQPWLQCNVIKTYIPVCATMISTIFLSISMISSRACSAFATLPLSSTMSRLPCTTKHQQCMSNCTCASLLTAASHIALVYSSSSQSHVLHRDLIKHYILD